MKRNCLVLIGFVAVLGLVMGCESRTDKTDGGGVLLSVSDFDAPPVVVSVNNVVRGSGLIVIESLTIDNTTRSPWGKLSAEKSTSCAPDDKIGAAPVGFTGCVSPVLRIT